MRKNTWLKLYQHLKSCITVEYPPAFPKLKPCPRCGSDAYLMFKWGTVFVECSKCRTRGNVFIAKENEPVVFIIAMDDWNDQSRFKADTKYANLEKPIPITTARYGYCQCRTNQCACGIPERIINRLTAENDRLRERIKTLEDYINKPANEE